MLRGSQDSARKMPIFVIPCCRLDRFITVVCARLPMGSLNVARHGDISRAHATGAAGAKQNH